ncbi:hypothetical protein CDV55_104255 [Aspergillus turcosus]|uniref:Amino acid permease/ SLC12A domain-containing protein n=1 Tax=Aspergillus turcosus TaxID=1245748 RepID=A0A229WWE6_9EURO|nr:hypothetical protein CDV55_104255 [Aspergillus turcosus]RLL97673.1 hypothetical protein CFD26_106830 [Aspergillus turcosus]
MLNTSLIPRCPLVKDGTQYMVLGHHQQRSLDHALRTAAQSPFIITASRAGVESVPSIANFLVLTSAWSARNSNLLNGSHTLYSLAPEGHAPKLFSQTSRWGVPYVAILSVGICVALGYMSLNNSASAVFTWLQARSTHPLSSDGSSSASSTCASTTA